MADPAIRRTITDPAALDALAHPVRLDLLSFLMSHGAATASECARAVDDSPSNCSYHLRVLAKHGLVESVESDDGRERPWRATITGLSLDLDSADPSVVASATAMLEAAIRLDYQLAREHVRRRDRIEGAWRDVDAHAQYGLAVNPDELRSIVERIDAIVRPYIAATRSDAPEDAAIANLSLLAFPRPTFGEAGR
ncbi:helix-turn-helix domain-containing protein [Microbacterium sp. QXD-8]|uniref:Helix-turn-helix domain-containing protein n=1 Tax=Microbacterium psychrotolerans TaxID=3068321 RepID=A0ABU0Z614_9MICO|nr:helix-turn-helix domain-containing protein [Microbacterium sp. QXD-8]MDQ7880027.1 helix-turn-helix domain-containing protein [Microbacterium sp. QXD-8]